ncbi:unnamed protein product [Rotaria sordida]|uniref:HAT C-terminal dimerisation domain-containing protein n=2 Tax=Rotaria sordida TaxID=392033 RepID=A0A815L9V1_9BILA|nr:unnamed protein product [Rotaria sordida]
MIGSKSHSAVPSSSSQSISTFFTVDIRNKSHATRLAKHKLKKAIAECCILDNRPFALADGPGFQKIIHEAMSIGRSLGKAIPVEKIIPNRTTISREIDAMYTFRKNQLKKIIKSINRYSITVDFWTESHTGVNFGGVSLHCYFKKHGLKSMVLACREYDLPNSKSPNIRAFTEGILSEFDLTINENVYIVTDNEPKMKAAFRDGAKRIGCSAHYVNKIIEHSLTSIDIGCDLIQQTFNQVKTIVTHIRQTHIQTKLSHSINLFCKTSICPQLKDEFYDVLKEEMNKRQSLEPKTHTTSAKLTTASATLKRKRTNLLADCYDPDPDPLDEAISNDETEIEKYIKACFTFDSDTDDLFDFRDKQQYTYPLLSSIAFDILVIPATNTSVERLFSTSAASVTNKRTRLNTAKIDKLMFLKSNLTFLSTFHYVNTTNSSSMEKLVNQELCEIVDDSSNDEEDNETSNNGNNYEDDVF